MNGTWDTAIDVPGIAALSGGGPADVTSVSCASDGNCAAGGWYNAVIGDESAGSQAFVADEVNGSWNAAIDVPGIASLNVADDAQITSVSCASTGNCAVGGYYSPGDGRSQAFVASEVNGIWNTAIEIRGIAAMSAVGPAEVTSVSCASAGNCVAGGPYATKPGSVRSAFVASELQGTWHGAIPVPGVPGGTVTSVSCASAGNCAAGGVSGDYQPFVASELNGSWRIAILVPGIAALNAGGEGGLSSISCAPSGGCAVGGFYSDSDNTEHPFVASSG